MDRAVVDDRLKNAAYDYKYLLTRGYPAKASLNLVAARYLLSNRERLLIYRCIHSVQYVEDINRKLVCFKISNSVLLLDFYNVLISTINMIGGGEVYMCDDCTIRDLRGSKLRPADHPYLQRALKVIAQSIEAFEPRYVIAIVDKNISFSLEHANMLGMEIKNLGIEYSFELTSTPDARIISYSKNYKDLVVASSDSIVMSQSLKIVPLTNYAMYILGISPVHDFAQMFNPYCNKCFDQLIQTVH